MLMQTHEHRLSALREEMKRQNLSGFVVPICDEHMSEYVGEYAQRLSWLTGFGGSAGTAVILADKAAIFTDGRYTEQVRDQVNGAHYEYVSVHDTKPADWIAAHTDAGNRIGYDPWLHTAAWVKAARAAAEKTGAELMAVHTNPVDAVWQDRPEPSLRPAQAHPIEYSGKSSAEKRRDMAEDLRDNSVDAAVIAALDSVAWMLNIRGSDVSNTPVTRSFALLHSDGHADLFVAPEKVTDDLRTHLGGDVRLHPYTDFEDRLRAFAGSVIGVDPERSVAAIAQAIEAGGGKVSPMRDPAVLAKAIKNPAEQDGTRAAHLRDGAALTRFLRWCAETFAKGGEDELSAAAKLREYREETGALKDLSFRTISAAGPHGALPHYSVDEDSNIGIETGQLYLVDSGGQYLDGTTDVTRVVAVGEPSAEMRRRYTQVLRGHIALAIARFPVGTNGGQLDALARAPLWADGVDYAHGTGHGVGSYLSVHEGPQRIAKAMSEEALQPGMICSNEPGYYKAGAFGIRIENLVMVRSWDNPAAQGAYLEFENLTWAPLERELIDASLLSQSEISWVDSYHAAVRDKIGPLLDSDDARWLETRCAALD